MGSARGKYIQRTLRMIVYNLYKHKHLSWVNFRNGFKRERAGLKKGKKKEKRFRAPSRDALWLLVSDYGHHPAQHHFAQLPREGGVFSTILRRELRVTELHRP